MSDIHQIRLSLFKLRFGSSNLAPEFFYFLVLRLKTSQLLVFFSESLELAMEIVNVVLKFWY